MMIADKTRTKIVQVYGSGQSDWLIERIKTLIAKYRREDRAAKNELTEADVMLITYADTVSRNETPALKNLLKFYRQYLKDSISIVHILPFFPYSSDDGFSITDYRRVKPDHGDWSDIAALSQHADLCVELVLNHCSSQSEYFQGYLAGDEKYKDFFIEFDPDMDVSSVVRPRTSPLFHSYEGKAGIKKCWTTFSEDQVDLNFKNPAVFLEMLDVLLFYISCGARIIRLDAVGYVWKESATRCIHLEQAHLLVQLIRDILDVGWSDVVLLTETNVPHDENISYFGDGYNEAQMVYNFSLPPLLVHTLHTGDAQHLTRWAQGIQVPSDRTAFLNFTASHDGIGVRPVADILSPDELDKLIATVKEHGGKVSYKQGEQGKAIPYEMNINYFDAINNPQETEPIETQIDRFMVSQSIALVFQGMPAIYLHSLIGSRSWQAGVEQTGQNRTINRETLNLNELEKELADDGSLRSKVYRRYVTLLDKRRKEKSFHPRCEQEVLEFGDGAFGLQRTSVDGHETILAIHNVRDENTTIQLEKNHLPDGHEGFVDLVTNQEVEPVSLTLSAYQFVWLKSVRQFS
ncbi:MAG: sugar phosphorylase [Planctomycetes bacterium]|nr:sugar phosphorylase [Planctomycetota bacterium]